MGYAQLNIVDGNIGGVQELKQVGDSTVLNFSLAVNRMDKTTWFQVALWNPSEKVIPYLTVGKKITLRDVELVPNEYGSPRAYLNKDGEPRASFDVKAQGYNLYLGANTAEQEVEETKEAEDDLPF